MVSQSVFALRDRQRTVLRTCLSSGETHSDWKVLICDQSSTQIVQTLFPAAELRRHAVTLQTLIHAARGPVPDTPALYIIAPTPDNIARVSNDLSVNPLYHHAQLVFTTPISRPLLVALAAQLPIPSPVTSVKDAYTSFISLEQNMFTLNMPNSYLQMNSVSDTASLDQFVQPIVDGIFSVLLTLGVVPIIRSQRGGAAEAVSKALDQRLRDNLDLFQSSKLTSRALSFRRPLLLMLDRDFDFNAILHHTWTYQPLVHDCLDFHLNRLSIDISEDANNRGQNKKKKCYTLNTETDEFWKDNAASAFPVVAERIEEALRKYRSDVELINSRAGDNATSFTGDKPSGAIETTNLAAAIATLPELSKRKETIDVHTNIATALLDHINKRSLDTFFELEVQIISEAFRPVSSMTSEDYKVALLELLKGSRDSDPNGRRGEGTPEDRLRLFLIYYSVFGRQLSEKDMAQFRGILHGAGADTSIIEHVGKLKGYRHDLISSTPVATNSTTKAAKFRGLMTSVVNRGYRTVANVAQNARKLITDQGLSLATASILELFMSEQARGKGERSAGDVLDGYLFLDPKRLSTPSASTSRSTPTRAPDFEADSKAAASRRRMHRTVFSDAIVFVVGGGNYIEYSNCMETVASTSTTVSQKNVLYGTTEIVASEAFLQQLSKVANAPR